MTTSSLLAYLLNSVVGSETICYKTIKMEDSGADTGDSEIQELDVSKTPVKVTKPFLETILGDIKLQFDSLKDAFIELKKTVLVLM